MGKADLSVCACVFYLEYVSFEDVVTQLHRLLPVQFSFLPRKHEGHQGMSAPVDNI